MNTEMITKKCIRRPLGGSELFSAFCLRVLRVSVVNNFSKVR